ncbi:hypothetical protein DY000_02008852 [Brassica cretica]|uniref:FBD domain-containing protein n=1 Tax=Brassica cretica TaxID=69181 RepID=A0ABQ7CBZ6_BRACR|nr:hypothetical protein DY000_02008852 [Brassica cretica]
MHCYQTIISKVSIEDLETIAKTCSSSLVSLKISGFDLLRLQGTLRLASVLEEFYGGAIVEDIDDPDKYFNADIYYFPPKLCHVGDFIGLFLKHISIMYAFADRLKTLDLFGAVLGNYAHCIIRRRLPNIEILNTSTGIGDEGLDVLSQYCKKLKVLEIRQPSDRDDHDRYRVTDRGMIHVATNCIDLEYITVCMMQLRNITLLAIAENLKEGVWQQVDGLARECKDLQRLELMFCLFSYRGIATAVTKLPKLRYIRVHAYETPERRDLCIMIRPEWRIQLCPSSMGLVAYASLDFTVTPWTPGLAEVSTGIFRATASFIHHSGLHSPWGFSSAVSPIRCEVLSLNIVIRRSDAPSLRTWQEVAGMKKDWSVLVTVLAATASSFFS